MKRTNPLRSKLAAGKGILGTFNWLASPAAVEILGYAGLDFIIIDTEHGSHGTEGVENLIRAADAAGIAPIVRVSSNDPALILRALDMGAAGVQVPQIDDGRGAAAAVRAARYHPLGNRGLALGTRATRYGRVGREDALAFANQEALVVIHIESVTAVGNLPEILAVDGADVFFVGPADMSQSLGYPGQMDHPLVRETVAAAIDQILAAGKVAGLYTVDAAATREWLAKGVQYLPCGADTMFLAQGYRRLVEEVGLREWYSVTDD